MITLTANSRFASYKSDDMVTTGSVGIPVTVILSEDYSGLSTIIVFRGSGETIDVALVGTSCVVPHECLESSGGLLQIGVYARNGEGTIVIPTVWAGSLPIVQGVAPSDVDPAEPTPDWTAQVQAIATEALEKSEEAVSTANDAKSAAITAQDSAQASASAAYQSEQNAAQSASNAHTSEVNAGDSASAAAGSASEAEGYAEQAAQYAAQAGYMYFYIDDDGHLIYQHTPNVQVDFYLLNGHLYVGDKT